jgi:hypothetical protein
VGAGGGIIMVSGLIFFSIITNNSSRTSFGAYPAMITASHIITSTKMGTLMI